MRRSSFLSAGNIFSIFAVMASPVDATGLAITAKIEKIFPAERKLDLRIGVDLRDLRLNVVDGHHKGSLDAVFTQMDSEEKSVAVRPLTYKLDLNPEDYQA